MQNIYSRLITWHVMFTLQICNIATELCLHFKKSSCNSLLTNCDVSCLGSEVNAKNWRNEAWESHPWRRFTLLRQKTRLLDKTFTGIVFLPIRCLNLYILCTNNSQNNSNLILTVLSFVRWGTSLSFFYIVDSKNNCDSRLFEPC